MKRSYFSDLWEFFVINKRLVIAVLVAASLIGVLQTYVSSNDKECLGIIDSKESTITYENSVVVKEVFVMAGETVERGQPLLEVEVIDPKKGRSNQITYAEEDSTIASIFFKPRERVAPFQPVLSFTSSNANLVYGFIHENRVSEFKTGDEVVIEAISDRARSTKGKVVSLGKRVIEFPLRFQNAFGTRYWGRELMVSIKSEKKLLTGEKVRIRTEKTFFWNNFNFTDTAQAEIGNDDNSTKIIASNLDLEASGLAFLDSKSILIASDSKGPNGSPFWKISTNALDKPENLKMTGLKKLDDVESVTINNGQMYALCSLSIDRKTKTTKTHRNLLIRFGLKDSNITVDRSLDLRTPILEAIKNASIGDVLGDEIEKLEVEAFSMQKGSAFFALKKPQLDDGSSIILKIKNLAKKVDEKEISSLDIEVYTVLKLQYSECSKMSRVTDMLKTSKGMLLLSTCQKTDNKSQVWWLGDDQSAEEVTLLDSFNTVLEGMAYNDQTRTLYLTSDHGKEGQGSDLMTVAVKQDL